MPSPEQLGVATARPAGDIDWDATHRRLDRLGALCFHREKLDRGSPHSGQINFAFCDGSVRGLSPAIDMAVFQALATIAGGEVVPGSF